MSLLGTTTRAETIQTIKELAATPDGMSLIRQFLASDEGVAAGEEPTANNQCGGASQNPQQFMLQQPSNVNVPNPSNVNFHQGSSVPVQYPYPRQHDVYGLPNQGSYQPQTHIMSLIKNEQEQLPNELATALSEHQGYNTPKANIEQSQQGHEIYGLPNIKPAAPFQGYYAPRSNHIESSKNEGVPHEEYNVPNEESNAGHETQEPQQEYGLPNTGESHASAQHETYGLPNAQEPVNFLQQGAYPPKVDTEESHASGQHETYGLPNVQEHVDFLQQGPYPSKTDSAESANSGEAIAPHQEYNVPNEDSRQTQVPHEIYGIPNEVLPATDNNQRFVQPHQAYSIPAQELTAPQQTYDVANNENENIQQDQQAPHNEYAAPSAVDTQASTAVQSNGPQNSYALPHQRFFESQNFFRQPQSQQSLQYGAPTKYNSNNQSTNVPILRQIGGSLDRIHTSLGLGQLLTTTLRPEAGFLERVGAWTRYFAPPGPTIPITPPQVTEDVNETVDHSPQNVYTIPIPMIPELNEPQMFGLPKTEQLPNVHIPTKFVLPPTTNQGPFVRVQLPLSSVSTLTHLNDYELPHQQPQPFDGQTIEEFVPDISQLPLDQRNLGSDLRTSYGIRTNPHSYAADSSPAASETIEQHVAVALPGSSTKHLNTIENEEIIENDVVDEEPQKKYGPQRISSYDSYATGKLNRANDDAIIQLIPTQKPYTNQARRLGQIEDSSIIDAIATMTSGFRPIS